MPVLARRTGHAEADVTEEDEDADDEGIQSAVDGPLHVARQRPGQMVQDEADDENGEVEGRIL